MKMSRLIPIVLIFALLLGITGQAFAAQSVTLDLKGADIKDVLRILAKIGSANIIIDEAVTGKVDLSVDGEPFDSVLEKVVRLNGFAFKKDGKTYLVTTPQKMQDFEPTNSTQIIKLNYATVSDTKKALAGVIAESKVQVDPRTNSLVVSGNQAEISQVMKIVSSLDAKPRKVIIETKIVEVSKTGTEKLGLSWTTFGQFQTGLTGRFKSAEGYGEFNDGKEDTDTTKLDPGFGATAKLDALVSDGDANILATPKIVMDDGKPAKILSGQKVPYILVDKDGNETAQFMDVGVKLEITTQILSDDLITAAIKPEVSSLVTFVAGKYPQIKTREAETTVSLKDGETMVLGGLIQQDDIETIDKVPLLGDVPILGELFKHKSTSKTDSELMIFITPHIVRD